MLESEKRRCALPLRQYKASGVGELNLLSRPVQLLTGLPGKNSTRTKLCEQNTEAPVEKMLARQGAEKRFFAKAETIQLIYDRLVAFELEALAEGLQGGLFVSGQQMNATELIVMVGVVGLSVERFEAEATTYLETEDVVRLRSIQTRWPEYGLLRVVDRASLPFSFCRPFSSEILSLTSTISK